jgi:2-keto-4-pentenoate hydratase
VEPADIEAVASALRGAEEAGAPIGPVRHLLPGATIETAYAVQEANVRAWVEAGRRVVGRKVGLTSEAVQRQLGVDQPDFGTLFADMVLASSETLPASAVLQPRVEAEVALVLGRDLLEPDTTVAELIAAVDHLLPAIEVVGSRIAGWDIEIVDTIADNGSSGALVLGTRPVRPGDVELAEVAMRLAVDATVVSTGRGDACLGHPYVAAVWLAREVARRGAPLRAGDVVLTGALGPMVPLVPGTTVEATLDGLGTVVLQAGA